MAFIVKKFSKELSHAQILIAGRAILPNLCYSAPGYEQKYSFGKVLPTFFRNFRTLYGGTWHYGMRAL
ncbi:MAG: hypothetical protein LBF66_02575 [Holosporales bacterium]|nr:hypothetical protein [Holosporales bacterium]